MTLEPTLEGVLDRIRAYRKEKGLSQAKFAQRADIHPNVLSGMDGEDWAPARRTIEALERVIREDPRP